MPVLSFNQAQQCVREKVAAHPGLPGTETVPLREATGRVLAQAIYADRDTPPTARSVRDGFAIRAVDVPGTLTIMGEVRAGEPARFTLQPGQALEIMTGAPVPVGADAVVMVEHATREASWVQIDRPSQPGDFINPAASECRAGDQLLSPGQRLTAAHIALLAMVGAAEVRVYRRPSVAILSTGDEVVPVTATPQIYEVRNSNAHAVAALVQQAGGDPAILPVAPDRFEQTRILIRLGLEADLLLLTGGVSAGKYDLVETVLAEYGAEFFFTRVLIQPGQPLVFGRARERFLFGLPGNPISSLVTFTLFAALALRLLGGETEPSLPLLQAPLAEPFPHKTGLTRFLPAHLSPAGNLLTPLQWQGSSDIVAVARANAYLVADADRPTWAAGDMIRVLPQ